MGGGNHFHQNKGIRKSPAPVIASNQRKQAPDTAEAEKQEN
jgi:hypothetical protein